MLYKYNFIELYDALFELQQYLIHLLYTEIVK